MDFWDIFSWVIVAIMAGILIWGAIANEIAHPGYVKVAILIIGGIIVFAAASDGVSSVLQNLIPKLNPETTEKIGRGLVLAYLIACYVFYQKNKKK